MNMDINLDNWTQTGKWTVDMGMDTGMGIVMGIGMGIGTDTVPVHEHVHI
jgi:hypothetical protein